MNQNIEHIIVIYPSELVLQGFTSLLSDTYHKELILAKHPDNISEYPHISGQTIIILSEEFYPIFINNTAKTFPNCVFKYIEVRTGHNNNSSADFIHINDTKSTILGKIKEVTSSFSFESQEKENNDLSKREIDVLMLLTKGHSNKEIANKLFISTHTVISHRKNITEKTGIRSASGLTMYAVLKKIIDIDDISTSELI